MADEKKEVTASYTIVTKNYDGLCSFIGEFTGGILGIFNNSTVEKTNPNELAITPDYFIGDWTNPTNRKYIVSWEINKDKGYTVKINYAADPKTYASIIKKDKNKVYEAAGNVTDLLVPKEKKEQKKEETVEDKTEEPKKEDKEPQKKDDDLEKKLDGGKKDASKEQTAYDKNSSAYKELFNNYKTNLDAQLTELSKLKENPDASFEKFINEHPEAIREYEAHKKAAEEEEKKKAAEKKPEGESKKKE